MTEEEWRSAEDPAVLSAGSRKAATDRKLRLFACGCCRRFAEFDQFDSYFEHLESGERLADTNKTKAALKRSRSALQARRSPLLDVSGAGHSREWLWLWLGEVALGDNMFRSFSQAISDASSSNGARREFVKPVVADATHLYRDVFGNPFRPVAFDPSWRTSTAVAIAKGMYDSRDFAAMPLLADALQDAGCEHADILDHCRGPGPHVKGCWVVDFVLGKE